ncbi:hypothetical protein AAKU61_001399 [Undibacterium sp. GrIS 1.2]|uniref:hypothetical protein n=1 Tax=Undibacterium sp. GrIS 1.2 TaxID=3143933 RepID=UPI00339B0726
MSIIEYLPIAFVIAAFALRLYVSSQDAFAKALNSVADKSVADKSVADKSVADKSVAEQFSRRLPPPGLEIATKSQTNSSVTGSGKNTRHLMAVPQ